MPYLGDFSAVRVDVRLSVCPKRPLQQRAVGLLLSARPVQMSGLLYLGDFSAIRVDVGSLAGLC